MHEYIGETHNVKRGDFLLMLSFITAALTLAEKRTTAAAKGEESDIELYLVAQRILTPPQALGAALSNRAQLLVGRLPEQFPTQVPIPSGAHIIGSLVRGPGDCQVALDVDIASEQVLSFYRQALSTIGGHEVLINDFPVTDTDVLTYRKNSLSYRLRATRHFITVVAMPMKDDLTDVRLHLLSDFGPKPTDVKIHNSRPAAFDNFKNALFLPELPNLALPPNIVDFSNLSGHGLSR